MTRKRVLNTQQRAEVRKRYMAFIKGRGYKALAREYGVGESTIRDIVKGYVS